MAETPKTDIKQSKGRKRFANLSLDPHQFNRPDWPPDPPAATPPANPMDLAPIPEAPADPNPAQVNQEEESPQNVAVDDPGQANQAHQANIQTLSRKRKLKSIDNQFSKNPS